MTITKNIQLHPELANITLGKVSLQYTKHAEDRLREKQIAADKVIDITKGSVVELELIPSTNKVTKMVVRIPYTNDEDKIYVLRLGTKGMLLVITTWTNHVSDNHSTLKLKTNRKVV